MQIAGLGSFSFSPTAGQATSNAGAAPSAGLSTASSSTESPEATFMPFMNMTPGQQMRLNIMSQMGNTQQEYNSITPQQQAAVNKEITEKIKEKAQQGADQKTGSIVDVSA